MVLEFALFWGEGVGLFSIFIVFGGKGVGFLSLCLAR